VIRFSVDGIELSRVLSNVLAFIPANSRIKTARVSLGPDGVYAIGTDTYAIGSDVCQVENYEGPPDGVVIELDKDALAEVEKVGRADRKKGRAAAEVEYGPEGLRVDNSDETAFVRPTEPTDLTRDVWTACAELLTRLERTEPALPVRVAFDPVLLSRFSKVKADKTERIADFLIYDAESPALVKIGPTFVGAIMPIHRETHARNVGEDGMWSDAA
jgi:hypothetical protein